MKISIVVRTHNDIPYIAQTLQCLQNQQIDAETADHDNRQRVHGRQPPVWIRRLNSGGINLEWPAGGYVPGKVLNFAVSRCSGDYNVFNNADSVPQNEHYLSALLRPLLDGSAQIVYAQQIPRKDARPLIRKDYRRAFGDGSVARTMAPFLFHCGGGSAAQTADGSPVPRRPAIFRRRRMVMADETARLPYRLCGRRNSRALAQL